MLDNPVDLGQGVAYIGADVAPSRQRGSGAGWMPSRSQHG